MPRRFLRGRVVRLLLTVVALASGVGLVCAIDLVNRAVHASFVEVLDTMAGRAALQVSAGDGALLPESVAETVAGVPGVELAVPVVTASAFMTDGSGEHLVVHGVDLANDDAIRVYEPAGGGAATMDDPLAFLAQRDSVMVTESFAARHGLAIDDGIEIETPSGRRRLVVRGLLAPTGVARVQSGNVLVMDIQSAQLAFTRRGLVSRVDVVLHGDADRTAVRDRIASAIAVGYRVDAPEQRRLDLHRVIASLQTLLQAVGMLGLAAAFLIAFSTLGTVFEARVEELAILRAVGVRRRWVHHELLREGALLGVAGTALGIPLGVMLGRALLPVITTATAIGAKLVETDAVVRVRPQSVALAATLGIGATLLAAITPARRASRINIVETLQGRGAADAANDASAGPRLVAVGGITAVVLGAHLVTGGSGLGLAASGLVVVTAVAACRPAIVALAVPLVRLAPLGGAVSRFAVAALVRAPRRTALAVATLGVGFGTVLWLWTLAASFERSVVEVMPGVLRGDLVVGSSHVGAGYIEAPLDDAILAEIAATPGVAAVAGEQTADWTHAGGPIALNAFDAGYFDEATFGRWRFVGRTLPDANAAVARGDAAIVSENFVHNVGGAVGDTLTLETPGGPVPLRIAGVVADFLSPRGTLILSRELYRTRWRNPHVTHALVRVAPGADVGAVRTAIATNLGVRHRVRVLAIAELVDWFAEQARRAFASLHVLGALVLVVVLVGVGDAMAAGALERTRDLGIMRAVGARRGLLGNVIVGEAVLLAALGIGLAGTLGLGLGTMWVKWTFPALVGWTLSLHIPPAQTGLVLAGTLAVCLLAAYLPARRAVRLDPVRALRTE